VSESERYWHEVEPPATPPDLRELLPLDAEHVFTVSFLLELPFSIRVEGARFLISADAHRWTGWTPQAMGALAGMPPLPAGVRPTHSVEIGQAQVSAGAPYQGIRKTFPEWHAATEEMRKADSTDWDGDIRNAWRSVMRVSMFCSVELVPAEREDELLEWLARRFDDALELANQYVVVLAAIHDEWQISSVSRIDLPPSLPYTLRLDPDPLEGPFEVNGSIDIHPWLKEDLPTARPIDEIQAAAQIVREGQIGRFPLFNWLELYQSAEHHLGAGRYVQSVIAAATGIEVLINTLFRVVWILREWDDDELRGILEAGFKNQLIDHLPKILDSTVDLKDEQSPAGAWHRDCYLLRNYVVHEGRKPTPAEGLDAKLATGSFAHWIGETMKPHPATDGIKNFLRAAGNSHPMDRQTQD
jgi:hypothetical protein